ncbi:hypothetical protein MKW92_035773, partial [Papaver armeniacum]
MAFADRTLVKCTLVLPTYLQQFKNIKRKSRLSFFHGVHVIQLQFMRLILLDSLDLLLVQLRSCTNIATWNWCSL